MRTYGKLAGSFWPTMQARGVSDDGKLLFAYLVSCRHGNLVGCYILPEGYITADLGWTVERVRETVSELLAQGLIQRCQRTGLTLLTGWWEHNTIENPNVWKAAQAVIHSLPRSSETFLLFIESAKTVCRMVPEQTPNRHSNLLRYRRKGYLNPFEIRSLT